LTGVFTGRPGDLWKEGLPGPEPQRFTLTGHGTARLPLTWSGEGFWNVGLPRFDFASPAPTPEPTSLLLLAAGIAGVGAVRRRGDEATQ
jgi:hypothetical protein